MSGAAPGPSTTAGPAAAAARLALYVAAVVLVTTRVGLVVHELIGHGGAANAVGAGVDEVRLFWFAGGLIEYSRAGSWTLPEVLVVQLAGIAIEVVVGLAAIAWARRRPGWTGLAVTGAGVGWVIHGAAYLAIGTWYGFGDGTILHRALGDAKAAVAIPAGALCAGAAYLAARALTSRLEAVVPSTSRAARLAIVAAAVATAGGLNAGLSRLELVVRDDPTYGAIMRPERDREIERELAAWLAAQRARGATTDADAVAARRRALDREHRTFPFGPVLVVAIVAAGAVGAARSRLRPDRAPDPPLGVRTLAAVGLAALAALALVVAAGAVFPL